MALHSLTLTKGDLKTELADFLGKTRDFSSLEVDVQNRILFDIDSGYRMAMFPPPVGDQAHTWSFLKVQGSETLVPGGVELPEDFIGQISDCTIATGGNPRIPIVSDAKVRALNAGTPAASGSAKVVAVRRKGTPTVEGKLWEMVAYPNAATDTVNFEYVRAPAALVADSDEVEGGPAHSELVLEACLACAELRRDDEKGIHNAQFMERLAASIVIDRESERTSADAAWPLADTSSSLDMTYEDLMVQVGGYMSFGWDKDSWRHEDERFADSLVQNGYRQFLAAHDWEFLKQSAALTVKLTSGTSTYDLAADFGGIVEDFTYPVGTITSVGSLSKTDEQGLRALQATTSPTDDIPKYYVIRSKANDEKNAQSYEVEFWPTPGATFDSAPNTDVKMKYRYNKAPNRLDGTEKFPLGQWQHAETVLCSILAVCEARKNPEQLAEREKYANALKDSIRIDSQLKRSGPTWPIEKRSSTLSMTWEDYASEISGYNGTGYNIDVLSHQELEDVDFTVQKGLRQALFPPNVDTREAQRWSFLEAIRDVSLWVDRDWIKQEDDTPIMVVLNTDLNTPTGKSTHTVNQDFFTAKEHLYKYFQVDDQNGGWIEQVLAPNKVVVSENFEGGTQNVSVSHFWTDGVVDATAGEITVTRHDYREVDEDIDNKYRFDFADTMVGETFEIQQGSAGDPPDTFVVKRYVSASQIVVDDTTPTHGQWSKASSVMKLGTTGEYFMPDDAAGIDGVLTFTGDSRQQGFHDIKLTSESMIRSARQNALVVTGRPYLAALKPTKQDGSAKQRWKLMVFPDPNQVYTLEYRYYQVPPKLTRGNPWPVGGMEHHDLFLASMLAVAEERKTGQRGPKWEQFMDRLRASQTKDRTAQTAEFIGYNGDASTMRDRRWSNYGPYSYRTLNVTYDGVLF